MNNKIYCKGGTGILPVFRTGKMPVPPIYWYLDCILNFRKIDTFGYKQLVGLKNIGHYRDRFETCLYDASLPAYRDV